MGKSADAAAPYPIHAPVSRASSRWPETKSAWKWVLITPTMVRPLADASSRYSPTSRRGSTTTAWPVDSSPMR